VKLTTYAYPWDLARRGVDEVLREMADHGIQALDLAAAYHPIDAVSPHDGARLFSDARGAVYFPARFDVYGGIKPNVAPPEITAAWPQAARKARALGLDLNAWLVTLFQPWIGDTYPEYARILPSGDPSGSDVCPSHHRVRNYVARLSADLAHQFDVGLVRLEGIAPHLYDLNWLRPRVLVYVTPLARTLLNLCFCCSCTDRAGAAGLDAQRVRRIVNDAIAAEINDGVSEASADRSGRLAENAEVRTFAALHVQSSIELVRAVRERLAGRAKISIGVSTPYGALLGVEAEDQLLGQFVEVADQVSMHPANPVGNERVAQINARSASPRDVSMLFARISAPGAVGAARSSGAGQMARDLEEAAARSAAEISMYAYSLLRQGDVAEFVSAVRKRFLPIRHS
jgi:hypothetical protein